ncbi:MAG TPA: hypothetical protein VJ036_01370 [bacterium]|jgi:hypothetical protein|nr:hypothetical protein [bacterium]
MTNSKPLPNVLAWPLAEAIAKLKQIGLTVTVQETSLPSHLPPGPELRVLQTNITVGNVEVVAGRTRTWPAGVVPPV